MRSLCWKALCGAVLAAAPWLAAPSDIGSNQGKDGDSEPAKQSLMKKQSSSPWLLVPLVSSNPKLGTSLGLMAGYVTKLDDASEPSLLGVQGQGSNTSSRTVGVGGKLYWNQNRDRVVLGAVGGKVTNDYLDFLGTGEEVRSDETLRAFFLRYQHELFPHWLLGVQAVYSNYGVDGTDPTSDLILDQAGLAGTVSSGVGLIASYDTRNNTNNTTGGVLAQVHNVAFRDSLGSDDNFDVLTADWRWYRRTGANNVVVLHVKGRWTWDAPSSRQSTVELRGYTRGQYLGRNSLALEAENRYMFKPRWGAKIFAGVACLYGGGKNCNGDNLFPMVGGGIFYILKPESNMVVSAEFATGKDDNRGFYVNLGHRF